VRRAAVDRARTALLHAVSHDLRTPLATIKAMASGLLDRSVPWQPEHVQEAHEVIDQEADRLNQLIGNLLDASRLETGTLAVAIEPTRVPEVIEAALRSLSGGSGPVEVHAEAELPEVLADHSLLERAVANVVDNARRYSPADSPITISADEIGDDVHLCVADRGPGIPPERRESVTAPFQRLDDRSGIGVGLGLSIVEGFVRAMGGRLLLDDTPGGGLTVTIVLRVAPVIGEGAA
jgi:two-component system, OmpR family, sensor histidine kinase KdpD